MTTPQRLERRVDALEARVDDIEASHGETLYKLRRESIWNNLRMAKILESLKIPDVSVQDVDQALDES